MGKVWAEAQRLSFARPSPRLGARLPVALHPSPAWWKRGRRSPIAGGPAAERGSQKWEAPLCHHPQAPSPALGPGDTLAMRPPIVIKGQLPRN